MKKIITLFSFVLLGILSTNAQVFWTENFGTTGVTGTVVSSYTGPVGTWGLTVTGSEGGFPNQWFVSCEEAGHLTGGCGTDCTTSFGLGPTLHLGSSVGDAGASYFASSISVTDRRANSPTINCTGRYGITMSFFYIEAGELTDDNATVWFSDDNGVSWSLLVDPPKTITICPGGQGYWTYYSVPLPTSANNNPNVKIGFRWVNDGDVTATDPSFAVDSITLSAPTSTVPVPSFTITPSATVCEDSCRLFDNTSTGVVDSLRWSGTGALIANPTSDTTSICFLTPGTFTITLTVYRTGTPYATTRTVTVNPAPHPVITRVGSVLSVPAVYTSYQWTNGITPIAGATTNSYTFTAPGIYGVAVDSGGCMGWDTITISTTGITTINSYDNQYWIAHPSPGAIDLYSSGNVDEAVTISVYDPSGRRIIGEQWEQGRNNTKVDCHNCAPGLYIIRLSGRNTSEVLKWLKE